MAEVRTRARLDARGRYCRGFSGSSLRRNQPPSRIATVFCAVAILSRKSRDEEAQASHTARCPNGGNTSGQCATS